MDVSKRKEDRGSESERKMQSIKWTLDEKATLFLFFRFLKYSEGENEKRNKCLDE